MTEEEERRPSMGTSFLRSSKKSKPEGEDRRQKKEDRRKKKEDRRQKKEDGEERAS